MNLKGELYAALCAFEVIKCAIRRAGLRCLQTFIRFGFISWQKKDITVHRTLWHDVFVACCDWRYTDRLHCSCTSVTFARLCGAHSEL